MAHWSPSLKDSCVHTSNEKCTNKLLKAIIIYVVTENIIDAITDDVIVVQTCLSICHGSNQVDGGAHRGWGGMGRAVRDGVERGG
jgi:hypothetical protein